MEILILILEAVVFLVITVVLLWSTKALFIIYEKWIDREDEVSSHLNLSEAIRRGALFLGSAIALSAPLINGSGTGLMDDIALTLLDAVAIIVLMLITTALNDKVLLPHIDNGDAVADGNTSVAFIEAGAYIATGFVLFGSFVGSGPWLSSIVFFALSQLLLLGGIRLYEWLTPFDFKEAITNDNHAAAVVVSAMMISYGVILSSVVSGNFVSWQADIYDFFISILIAVPVVAVVFNTIIDRLFFPSIRLSKAIAEKDIAVAVMTAALKISLAIIVAQVVV